MPVVLMKALWERALRAHREAQGGGSGVDVAASTWGGTLIARRTSAYGLDLEPASLPHDLVVEVWTSPVAASTPALLAAVAGLRERAPEAHRSLLGRLGEAAERAATALRGAQTLDLIHELTEQRFPMLVTIGCDAIALVAIVWQLFPIFLVPACA